MRMDKLLEGYHRFLAEVWPAERDRYEALSRYGQRPHTMVVGCSDSRVDPRSIFGAAPGELFEVRNVAGLVPPYRPDAAYHGTSAALEYAVRVLAVARIVVLGHSQCGGVRAMVEGPPEQARDFVGPWMQIAEPARRVLARQGDPGDLLERGEVEVVRLSLVNLGTFPWIASAVAAGRLQLAGFRFDIGAGLLARVERDRLIQVT
jgi:carbonic anhydrase